MEIQFLEFDEIILMQDGQVFASTAGQPEEAQEEETA